MLSCAVVVFALFDSYALDLEAIITVTDQEVRYQPSGVLLKRFIPPQHSPRSPRVLQRHAYAFQWERKRFVEGEGAIVRWVVEARNRGNSLDVQTLWVDPAMPGISRLQQLLGGYHRLT